MNKISSIDGLIDAFGGPSALAKAINDSGFPLKVSANAVGIWKVRERINPTYHGAIVEAATSGKIPLTAKDLAEIHANREKVPA